MRRIFTSSFIAAALVAASFNSFAQDCSATQPNASVCSGTVAANFNSSTQSGFGSTNGDFTYTTSGSAGYYEADKGTNQTGATAVITSPSYVKSTAVPNAVQAGFLLTIGNKVTVTGIKLEVLNANTNAVVATCSRTGLTITSGNGDGTQCFGITSSNLTPGLPIKYRFTITFNTTTGSGTNVRFDDFSYGGNSNAALPVKFTSFDGKIINGGISLTWNVASEENLSRYEVEKSTDNKTFVTIGSVEANGNETYSMVDTKATTATSYYRIKGVDVDGKFTYSVVITVKGAKSSIALKAFPMPVLSELTLQHATAVTGSEITVSSTEGRQVKSIIPAKGSQQTVISLGSLTPGVYLVRYSNINGEVETLKIVKQ